MHLIRGTEEFAPANIELKIEGAKVTGTLNELTVAGDIQGDAIKLTATRPSGVQFGVLEGKITGQEVRGTARLGEESIGFVMRRRVTITAAPKTHTFEPKEFHRLFSGTIAPALRINPGDTVKTTTVDAGGRDSKMARRSAGTKSGNRPFLY